MARSRAVAAAVLFISGCAAPATEEGGTLVVWRNDASGAPPFEVQGDPPAVLREAAARSTQTSAVAVAVADYARFGDLTTAVGHPAHSRASNCTFALDGVTYAYTVLVPGTAEPCSGRPRPATTLTLHG